MLGTTTVKGTAAKVECIIPILNVRNFAASIDYYVNVLGFRLEWDWGDPPEVGSIIPILNVRNASIDYYVNVLGFRLEWDSIRRKLEVYAMTAPSC